MSDLAVSTWKAWTRDANFVGTIPEARYAEALSLISFILNQLTEPEITFVDVGCACGNVLELLRSKSGLEKRIYSIGIDPVDRRASDIYNEFLDVAILDQDSTDVSINVHAVSSCSSVLEMINNNVVHEKMQINGANYYSNLDIVTVIESRTVRSTRLSTALEATRAANGIIHFLKIDAQGVDLAVFRSLQSRSSDVLFVQIETIIKKDINCDPRLYYGQSSFEEDSIVLKDCGFRPLNIADFVVTPEADVIFVNLKLLEKLLPGTTVDH